MEVVTPIPCQKTSRGRPQFKDTIFMQIRFRWVELGQNLFLYRRFHFPVAFPKELWQSSVGNQMEARMKRTDVQQGTLALMVLKTLQVLGPLHGYGIARRIEQISGDRLQLNYGTLYPALLKLEQDRHVSWEWAFPRTAARRSSTPSRRRASKSWKKKSGNGAKRPPSWPAS